MKRSFTSKFIAAAVFAGATLGLSSAAQARPEVQVSIGLPGLPFFPGLPIFVQPRPVPVYIQQEPVYVQQEPVYVQPRPVYGPPAIVYERPWVPSYRYEYEREHAWRHGDWQRREWEHRHQDRDQARQHDYDGHH